MTLNIPKTQALFPPPPFLSQNRHLDRSVFERHPAHKTQRRQQRRVSCSGMWYTAPQTLTHAHGILKRAPWRPVPKQIMSPVQRLRQSQKQGGQFASFPSMPSDSRIWQSSQLIPWKCKTRTIPSDRHLQRSTQSSPVHSTSSECNEGRWDGSTRRACSLANKRALPPTECTNWTGTWPVVWLPSCEAPRWCHGWYLRGSIQLRNWFIVVACEGTVGPTYNLVMMERVSFVSLRGAGQ